jgi:hypothetical protein
LKYSRHLIPSIKEKNLLSGMYEIFVYNMELGEDQLYLR